MKRLSSLLAVVVLLLTVTSVAQALSRVLHGPAGGGSGSVDVQFTIKNGHATKITRFEFNNIPATCQGFAPTAVSNTFAHHIPVATDGKFHATEKPNGGRVTYTVSGHFVNLHKAAGKLRVKGAVPGCANADTGTVHWTAKG